MLLLGLPGKRVERGKNVSSVSILLMCWVLLKVFDSFNMCDVACFSRKSARSVWSVMRWDLMNDLVSSRGAVDYFFADALLVGRMAVESIRDIFSVAVILLFPPRLSAS